MSIVIIILLSAFPLFADCVTDTLVMEAANQPHNAKVAIMNAIQNRSKARHKSLEAIVSERHQFGGYEKRALARSPEFIAAYDECEGIVRQARQGSLPDLIGNRQNFRSQSRRKGLRIAAFVFF